MPRRDRDNTSPLAKPTKERERKGKTLQSVGAPTGTVPRGKIAGGGPWSDVNRWDDLVVAAGARHGVNPALLKSMMIVESGGKANAADPHGAVGLMQVKPQFWSGEAAKFGYDLTTPAGQIGTAAAILGGAIPWVKGATPEERFLSTYYPTPGLDVLGESGHTPRMYLTDIALYMGIINAAVGAVPSPVPPVDAVVTFGRTPHPPFQDRPIPKDEGNGWDDLGQRSVKGVVLHRMLGSLWGTDTFFRGPVGALTDYGVGVTGTDGADKDGQILRWNDPLGRRSGWASGPVSGQYGDGAAFVAKFGVVAVNRDLASIEISGHQTTPLSAKAFEAVAGLTAYWADQARVPWSGFPFNPATGISFVYWHQEFTRGTGKLCPFEVVIAQTTPLIERAKAILKQHQTGASPGPGPTPTPPPPKDTRLSKVPLPAGVTVADLGRWFGPGFDANGIVSECWAREAVATGRYPKLVESDPSLPRRVFRFEGNLIIVAEGGKAWVLRLDS